MRNNKRIIGAVVGISVPYLFWVWVTLDPISPFETAGARFLIGVYSSIFGIAGWLIPKRGD